MDSPLEHIKNWYLSLPVDQRIDIGVIIGSSFPGFDGLNMQTELDEISDKFIVAVDKGFSSKTQEVGMVLLLRTGLEFNIISRRSDPSQWQETKQNLEFLAKEKNSETFAKSAQRIEFRAKQWQITCDKWNSLKAILSDDYLAQYEKPYN